MSQKNDRAARRAKLEAIQAAERRKKSRTLSLAGIGAFVAVVGVVLTIAWLGNDPDPATASDTGGGDSRLVRSDSHRLTEARSGQVTLVEFLDFECEACRAAHPLVEDFRKEYEGRVTFVARYFPIPSHFNAERAARAVESAAQQGKFEQMYQRMFETQSQWGEQQVPADETFRGFAKDLGLDMTRYDKTYEDPATLMRIKKDVTDGEALGVQGTPTFFLNGEKLQPNSYDDFKKALDAALAE
ncbi:DsbA family protein [Actinopolymorpha pittospori]|uniref:Protein-disulfide isomerase n=1 Tax=Actinopolymorpha pittospori TaxID=648752 RepID=A0A927RDC8_9ACTN|nr:thioredoxin domain-containing protein [Actinopolymorpha pittospori]MBE1608010.1 protein-disulfide isomerase [Actinopolymorpha pittospori]